MNTCYNTIIYYRDVLQFDNIKHYLPAGFASQFDAHHFTYRETLDLVITTNKRNVACDISKGEYSYQPKFYKLKS